MRRAAAALLPVVALACRAPADKPGAPGADTAPGGDTAPPDTGGDSGDTGAPIDPRAEAVIAAAERDIARSAASGASIAIWLNGEAFFVGGVGTARPGADAPIGRDTLFQIGSDTKKLTALSLLRAEAAGRLSRTDALATHLPELELASDPGWLAGATVHHLIAHQGGLQDWYDLESDPADAALERVTFGAFAAEVAVFNPAGAFYNYSNPNFSLAGLVDERAAGAPWASHLEADLLPALGLTRTVPRRADIDADAAAGVGYLSFDSTSIETVEPTEAWEGGWTRPAGLVWGNSLDQARLAGFLIHGDEGVLPTALLDALRTPHAPLYPDIDAGGYGYGLIVGQGFSLGANRYYDAPVWSHGGNTLAYTSTFYILPEQDFAVSVLSNGTGDDFIGTVVAAVEAYATLPDPVDPPAPAPFEPMVAAGFAGTYIDPTSLGTVEIGFDPAAEALTVSMPDLDAAGVPYRRSLTAYSTRVWGLTIDGYEYDVSFIEGADGTVYLRNRAFVAARAPTARPATAAGVDPAALRRHLRRARLESVPALLRPAPRR